MPRLVRVAGLKETRRTVQVRISPSFTQPPRRSSSPLDPGVQERSNLAELQLPTGSIGPGTYIFQGHRLSGAFYAGALCATVPIGRAQSQPTVPHASVLCTVQVVHSKQSSDGRLPRSCGLITVDSDIAPSLLYHQCFAARNHSALRSPSARLYGNLASAPCLLYEHKTFPPSLSLLLLSLSQDHSGRRPRSRVRIIVTLCAILCLSEISQPRTPVQANILLCALCPEHSQLP